MSSKSIILDFDGTIFNGIGFMPQFQQLISQISDCKLTIFTNNDQFSTKELTDMIQSQIPHRLKSSITIINPAKFITAHLKELIRNQQIHAIYTLIQDKLFEELQENFQGSIKFYRAQDHDEISQQIAENITLKNDVDAILIGVDESEFNFCSISLAARYVLEKNAQFFVVGSDHQFLKAPNNFIPGPYALSTPVQHATSINPIILGKPNIESLNLLDDFQNAIKGFEDIWVIGDGIETDLELASSLNAKSIIVLTGVATIDDLNAYKKLKPTFVCNDLAEVANKLVH
mgnify:CR=1 FL=1